MQSLAGAFDEPRRAVSVHSRTIQGHLARRRAFCSSVHVEPAADEAALRRLAFVGFPPRRSPSTGMPMPTKRKILCLKIEQKCRRAVSHKVHKERITT